MFEELKRKKILILGFGREGQDTFLFLRKQFPKKLIGIADQNQHIFRGRKKYVAWYLGKNYLKVLNQYDVIIKSPGIAPHSIAPFLSKKQRVTSQTEIFFENCKGTIIGVTGTKGKSTTASLIHTVLQKGGFKTHLIGNIEKPVLQFLEHTSPEDIFVYELSSFQLTNLKRSPTIAVLLNLYPEHLNYYQGDFLAYAKAKANITKYQTKTDFLIYNSKDEKVCKISKSSKAQKIPFTPEQGQTLLWRAGSDPAQRFIASIQPAILIGKLFGIPQKKIQQALKTFKSLPHRLEKVGQWKGITFYNDSLATIPEATCAALDILGPKVHTLIAGGFDRGLTLEKLGKKIEKSNIKTLVLFPTTGEKILASIRKPPRCFFANTMEEAVRRSYAHTPKGTICLLSPAASSFNMFKDYKDRGEQFKRLAKRYGEKA